MTAATALGYKAGKLYGDRRGGVLSACAAIDSRLNVVIFCGIVSRNERAHAVAEEYDGLAGILLAGDIGKGAAVNNKISPAVFLSEIAEIVIGLNRFAVADMILCKDRIAVLAEPLCKAGITLAVLRHTVGYLEYGLDAVFVYWRPAAGVNIAETRRGLE